MTDDTGSGNTGSPLTRAPVQLGLVAFIQVFGLSVWFTTTAVAPALREELGLSTSAIGWMTVVVQAGFVVGALTSALVRLADNVKPRYLIAVSALGAAACTLGTTLTDTYAAFLLFRFLTGVFLAGIYPVGMKVVADWASPATKARAFGILIACLTIGSAMPLLIRATLPLPWRWVMVTAALFAVLAALVSVLFVRDGPNAPVRTARLTMSGCSPASVCGTRGASTSGTSATCGSCTPSGRGSRCSWRLPRRSPAETRPTPYSIPS